MKGFMVKHRVLYSVGAALLYGVLGNLDVFGNNCFPTESVAEIEWRIVRGFVFIMTLGFLMALPFILAQATLPEFKWKRESVICWRSFSWQR